MAKVKSKKVIINSDQLNLLMAICAILISIASFYATYLQASSAEKQVQAMTLPIIQFQHGNYSLQLEQRIITFKLQNAGIGPAIIRNLIFSYNDNEYDDLNDFLRACCSLEYEPYRNLSNSLDLENTDTSEGIMTTKPLNNIVVAGQSEFEFMQLPYGRLSENLWDKLNLERSNINLHLCYCTLLDDCYSSEGNSVIEPVKSCPLE